MRHDPFSSLVGPWPPLTMGCCTSKDDDLPPAFDPVISLSDKLIGPEVTRDGNVISGSGSVMGDSPILQDKAYFEVTIARTGTFAFGVATRDVDLGGVLSQDKVRVHAH